MKLSKFNYNLPKNLITQKPTRPRDHCRLLVVRKNSDKFEHFKFFDIEKFLQKGDVVVLNDSKVIPARILGNKSTSGSVEILLIKKISNNAWEAMLRNFKEKELGKKIIISSSHSSLSSPHSSLSSSRMRGSRPEQNLDSRRSLSALLAGGNDSSDFLATPVKNIGEGLWQIKFNLTGAALDKAIHKYGRTPLPPYIKKMAKLSDYQTIYAQKEGSVAAPTAGLHFTKRLINKLKKKGIIFETVTLHVGLGTFSPIREENIEKHKMHAEFAEISAKTAKAINKAKSESRRVIAVGTTSVRTLEAFVRSTHNLQQTTNNKNQKIKIKSGTKNVDIFIKPGYKFKITDGMITNFHLPETTLMILVSAFAGREKIIRAYQEAIKKKYKFFSFGDAMFII